VEKPELHDLVCKLKILADELDRTPTLKEFELSGVSKRQILKHGYNNIVRAIGAEPNKRPRDAEELNILIRPPRILMLDIETSPIMAKVWGLYDQNISLNQIEQDWYVLSYAAKWYGDDKFYYMDQRYQDPITNDFMLLEGIHYLLSECDYACGHNIARFDYKKLNARFIKHGLPPLKPIIMIDTLRIAKRHFAFTSNKLEYLAKFLECKNLKSEHGKFHGMEMWNQTMKGNLEAFEEMELYNKMDVTVLEEVYEKLIKYDQTISFQSFYQNLVCTCGSHEFKKNGQRYTRNGAFQLYTCAKCGKHSQAKENLIDKEIRKELHK
jgi:hypothetical protein